MVDDGLHQLASWGKGNHPADDQAQEESDNFMALDDESSRTRQLSLQEQTEYLKAELEALRRVQKSSFEKIDRLSAERKALLKRQQALPQTNGANELGEYPSSSSDEG